MVAIPVLVVVLLFLGVLKSMPTRAAEWLAGFACTCPLIGGYVVLVRRRALSLTDTGLRYYNGVRERAIAAPGAVLKIVEVRIGYRWRTRDWRVWLFIGRSGECLFCTAADMWPVDKLEKLRGAMNLPIERRSNRMSPRQLRGETPRSASWLQAHVVMATLLLILVVSIAVTLLR